MRQLTFGFAGTLLLAAFLLLLGVMPAQAEEVSGAISGTATWTLDNSPYEVTGDILVEHGASLTIEPGVTVEFQGPYEFRVDGRLTAVGSIRETTDPTDQLRPWNEDDVDWIRFTQAGSDEIGEQDPFEWADENRDDLWRGIRFSDADGGSALQWAIIEFGYARGDWPDNNGGGLYVRAVSVDMQNLVIRYNGAENFGGGVFLWSTASTFRNNLVAHNRAEEQGGGIYIDQSTSDFYNLTLVDNDAGAGTAIYFGPNIEPFIRSTIFGANPEEDTWPYNEFNEVDIRNSTILARFNSNGDPMVDDLSRGLFNDPAFAETDYYTLADSSEAIDTGIANDPRVQFEPEPSGGPTGPRINMGAWGGTPFAATSKPVISFPEAASVRKTPQTQPGDTTNIVLAFKNVGADVLDVTMADIQFSNSSGAFSLVPFEPIQVQPDSADAIEVLHHPFETSPEEEEQLVTIGSNGGSIVYEVDGFLINAHLVVDFLDNPMNGDTLLFGEVHFDAPETLRVALTNTGTTLLNGLKLRFSDDNWRVRPGSLDEDNEDAVGQILPGATLDVDIIANPEERGRIITEARFTSNAEEHPFVASQTAVGPKAFVFEYSTADPDSNYLDFAFANEAGDSTQVRTIVVRNDGNRDLEFNAEFSNNSFSAIFPSGGTLAPDSTDTVRVVFNPNAQRTFDETMTLQLTDTQEPPITVEEFEYSLRGRGTGPGLYFSGVIPNPETKVPSVWGPEELGGNGNTRFIVAGPARIPPGETLTILPGVEVLFESPDVPAGESTIPSYIVVEGELQAVGTPDELITFAPLDSQLSATSTESNPVYVRSRHGGLRLLASEAGTRLENVVIDSGRTLNYAEMTELYESQFPEGETPPAYRETIPSHLSHGGGLSIYNCSPLLQNVTITNSLSHQDGGGLWVYQGAPTIVNSTITNNEATGEDWTQNRPDAVQKGNGGGVVFWGSKPKFHANVVQDNLAHNDGGGLYIRSLAAGQITNSLFTGNSAMNMGGAAVITGSATPLLLNDVFADNSADAGNNGLMVTQLSKPVLRNSVVWGVDGSDAISYTPGSQVVALDSYIEGGFAGGQNIYTDDPQYNSNFRPSGAGSNLVDAGSDDSGFQDYSFPPSLGTPRADVGITGGPFAGYWGAPLELSVFRNPANSRSMKIVVTSSDPLNSTPELTVTDFSGDDNVGQMEAISSEDRAWGESYQVSESTVLTLTASALWENDEGTEITTSVRREVTVAIYTQPQGAALASGGNSFTVPPYALGKQSLLIARASVDAELPPEAEGAMAAGPRWMVDAPGSFSKPAEVRMPFNRALVPAGREHGVAIWRRAADGSWLQLESFVSADGAVTASTRSGGTFVVVYEPASTRSTLLPTEALLQANYPNPFNPTTTIPFVLPSGSEVELAIYNVMGRRVATVTNQYFNAGAHQVVWNGLDAGGSPVASGMYFYRMTTRPGEGNGISQTRKLVLMR